LIIALIFASKSSFSMNKQNIFNIVTGLGLALLFILHFSNRNTASSSASDMKSQTDSIKKTEREEGAALKVGFIRTDSLLTTYERHKELQKVLEGKMGRMEKEWEHKTRVFQENLKVLEEEAPKMSQRELQMAQQELEMKQQELMAFRESKTQELMREEQELNKSLYEEVYEAINKVQEKLGLDMVFMLEMGGSLVWGHDAFDITKEMAAELNARYKTNKEKK
jgi:outer membrane protein